MKKADIKHIAKANQMKAKQSQGKSKEIYNS